MPTKRKTAAKSKKSPDPPARLSPAPTPVSSPDVSDDESIPGHADRNPSAPVLTKEGQTNLTSKEQAEKQTDSQPSSKKKRKPNLMLSEQQEDDVADWIQEHPLFYSKGVKEYNDTAKKQRLWNMKAREHNLESSALLLTWYESMRKSGDGVKELTDRDQWIMTKLHFLKSHISRMPGKQAVNLKANISATSCVEPSTEADDSGPEAEEIAECELPSMSGSYGKQTVTQKGKGKKTVSKDKKAEAVVEKLTEQQQISDQLHVKIKNVLKESEAPSPRKTWGAWLTAMLPCLHDNVINGFFRQSFELMMTHVEESNNIRAKEMQQPQQPQQVNETNRPVQQSEIVQSTQQQFSQPQQVYHFGQSPQKQQQQFNQYPQQQVSPTPQIQHPQYHPITGQLISGQYAYQQTQQFVQDTSVMGPIHSATNVLDDDA